ncbi:armadillo-type protein [Pisolithus marmoratus]|nr:armadillo-type protein [Pisolithus marmoratus]
MVHGACQHEPSSDVQLAAVHALYDSLEFMHTDFKHGGEHNHIKQVMCEATQNSSVSVQVGAFEYLVKIMALYYDKMVFYMEQALFMATDYGELPKIKSKLFAKIALPEVIPVLLSLLTLQEEVVDEGEWNISMSVGTCFNFMAQADTDMIVDAVIPFIEAHIKSPDGHQQEAAMMAFKSVLDGPYPSILTCKSGAPIADGDDERF